RTLNIAHRGGGKLAPEATLLAFETALANGADVLEFDLHASSDGKLVILHDDTVERTTDGTGAVKDLTFDELRKLDAAYDFSLDGGQTFPQRGKGITIPTPEEVFAQFPSAWFVIEIKQETPSIVGTFATLLDTLKLSDRVLVGSFKASTIQAFRAAAPGVRTSFALDEVIAFISLSAAQEAGYKPPGEFLQVPVAQGPIEVVNAASVEKAKRLGLGVHVWTINDPTEMGALIDLGVAGIITDDPKTLADVLSTK
ncbi:MAG TPA: glycerophosphodiester phosphodiesterase, partial [Polyangiaceae bacterium]|nr:glycerophosphodiester phosphodiesterase [Polyangiaceae bacterium]